MTSNQMDSARPDKNGYRTDLHISPKCGPNGLTIDPLSVILKTQNLFLEFMMFWIWILSKLFPCTDYGHLNSNNQGLVSMMHFYIFLSLLHSLGYFVQSKKLL